MTTKKVGRPRKQEQHIEPDFYVVVDHITKEILASFDKDFSWASLSNKDNEFGFGYLKEKFGFGYLKEIEQSARFKSLEEANEAIKNITTEMTTAGETKFNFEVVGIKVKTITIEKVEGVQTIVDRLGIA